MPTVKLSEYECRRGLLPGVCMFCGAPATTRVERRFSWHPSWVYLLILINLLVTLIVALILTKKMTVRVPVCDEHEGFWRRRMLILVLTFLLVAACCTAALVYLAYLPPAVNDELTPWLCGGGVILFFAWLIVAAIYSSAGVRPTEITESFISLSKVHEDFVDALRDERARDREEGDRRRNRYGDERDDYDDLPDDDPPPRSRRSRDHDYDDYDDYDDDRPRRR
jgi:hypothetical protein